MLLATQSHKLFIPLSGLFLCALQCARRVLLVPLAEVPRTCLISLGTILTVPPAASSSGAAGNFLCPASALSFNAFKTVIDIDTIGTFNTSKVLFEKYFRVSGTGARGLHRKAPGRHGGNVKQTRLCS